jgi:hypothetical protein
MAKLNVTNKNYEKTHEGATSVPISYEKQLRRSLMCCMLWEDSFYEDGESIATRISELVPKVAPNKVANLVIEARNKMGIRHASLLVAVEMLKYPEHKKLVAKLLPKVINRADELKEILALYWRDGKKPIPAQLKKGIAASCHKFREYHYGKYNKKSKREAISFTDVFRLCHPKPQTQEQEELYRKVVKNELVIPDTWETQLSAGSNKKETFERLINENKLGSLATLRNIRNMQESGVSKEIIGDYLLKLSSKKLFPFNYIGAAIAVPQWEDIIEQSLLYSLKDAPKFSGKTVLLVDVSGSMNCPLSSKSKLKREDAAAGLTMLLKEQCENVQIVAFSNEGYHVPPRRGFALRDFLRDKCRHGGTDLGGAVKWANENCNYDRIIVVTDEQSYSVPPNPKKGTKGYMLNVASYKNGIGRGPWVTISGWSNSVLDYIREHEIDGKK